MKILCRTCGGSEYSDFAPYAVIDLDEATVKLIQKGRQLLREGMLALTFLNDAATFLSQSVSIEDVLGEERWDGGAGVDDPIEIDEETYAAFLKEEAERTTSVILELYEQCFHWTGSSKYGCEEKETITIYYSSHPDLFPDPPRSISARYEVVDRGGGKGSLWAYVTIEGEPEFKGSGVSLMSGPLKDIQEYVNKEISHEEVMNRWHMNRGK